MPATPDIDTILPELNEQQRSAAGHDNGPLLIIAGAGTGKTATLAHRVACLIATGIDPGRILLLTFTRRASAEMLRRVDQILERSHQKLGRAISSGSVARRVWGGMFHAVASRLLRLHCDTVGLPRAFTILDRGDSEDLMQEERAAQGLGDSKTRFPLKGTCLDIYSRCVNCRKPLAEVLETAFPWCRLHLDALKGLFHAYVDRKESLAVIDYDDLLLYWHALFEKPETAEVIRS